MIARVIVRGKVTRFLDENNRQVAELRYPILGIGLQKQISQVLAEHGCAPEMTVVFSKGKPGGRVVDLGTLHVAGV